MEYETMIPKGSFSSASGKLKQKRQEMEILNYFPFKKSQPVYIFKMQKMIVLSDKYTL